jgi:hypothetical protein
MKNEVMPGTKNTLTVTGIPFMHVGLNIIDKALLLQNNKNVLRKIQASDKNVYEMKIKCSAVIKFPTMNVLRYQIKSTMLMQRSNLSGVKGL